MRRIFCILAILLLIPTLAFSQARMRPVMSHPPADSMPGDDMTRMPSPAGVGGLVSAVNGNLVSIASGAVVIDMTSATFDRTDGTPVTIGSIKPGDYILAFLKTPDVAAGAPLPAAVVTIVKLPDAQLSGNVQAVDTVAQTLTVLGQTVRVTVQTRFIGPNLNDLRPGDFVSILATVSGGKLVADSVVSKSINVPPIPPLPTHFRGKVKAIATESWTITDTSGTDVTVLVDRNTKILGAPVVGSTVEVIAYTDSSNRLVALSILNADPFTLFPPMLTYTGKVKTITSGEWVVRDDKTNTDLTFIIWPLTRIEPGIGMNQHVRIQAQRDAENRLFALAIAKEP